MIEINLLPPEIKNRKRQIELPEISFLPIVGILAVILAAVYVMVAMFSSFQGKKLTQLEAEWEEIAPEKRHADRMKRDLGALENRVNAIEDLMRERPLWSKRLMGLNDSMIPGIWLRRFWLEKRQETVVLPGKGDEQITEVKTVRVFHVEGSVAASGGEETAAIGRFIRSLKMNEEFFEDFSDIQTGAIQRRTMQDIEVMNFELILPFKEGRK